MESVSLISRREVYIQQYIGSTVTYEVRGVKLTIHLPLTNAKGSL